MLRKKTSLLHKEQLCLPRSSTEIALDARQMKERAKRYRKLAESLHDDSIISVVLEFARELEQAAEATAEDH